MPLRRPRALIVTGSVLAAVALAIGAAGCAAFGSPAVSTIGAIDFETPLAIPPLAPSTVTTDGTRVFDLTAQPGESQFVDGVTTATNGYDGAYMGPTLRATRGEKVEVRFHNELTESTTVHWHGMHLPAAMDGGPHQPVAPGEEWDPAWTVDQPAATLWYHPHPHGETEGQVRSGLFGMFLLDDEAESALPLPKTYGVDDIPVAVQDVAFGGDGQLVPRDGGFIGNLGDRLLVNGTIGPYLDVTTDVVRLRLLNASSARIYDFRLSDGSEFDQIASDGGLLDAPFPTTEVQLSPGERAEILVTMTPGETVVLRSESPDYGGTLPFFGGSAGSGDRFDVLELRAAASLAHVGEVPDALVPVERLDPATASTERTFDMDGTQINQHQMSMNHIDEVVELGATEIWNVTNGMAFPHNFHVHDVQFQVLTIGGEPPPPALAGWKDTVYLRPNTQYRLIMRFDDYADPDHPYMYHCHLLRHEDSGMMGQFLVLEPGQTVPDTFTTGTMETDDHDH
jgi:suppressor of ftsI